MSKQLVVDRKRVLLALSSSILILLTSYVLLNHPIIYDRPILFVGITYDLAVFLPLVYLLLIWKSGVSKLTVFPVFIISIIIASFLIPVEFQSHLDIVKTVLLPIIELSVITIIIIKVRHSIQVYGSLNGTDQYELIQQTAIQVLNNKKIAAIFSTEMGMIYYSLFHWKGVKPNSNQFTGFKNSGITAIFGTLIFLIVAETAILHLLLINYYPLFSWILFFLSIYTGLQVLGHLKALRSRFVELGDESLKLRYGLFGDSTISYHNIKSVEVNTKDFDDTEFEKLSLLGPLEGHNIVLRLNEKSSITKVYGITKKSNTILLYLDEPERFVNGLNEKLSK